MSRNTLPLWLTGLGLGVLLALLITLDARSQACAPDQSCSTHYTLADANPSAIAVDNGLSQSTNYTVTAPSAPTAGGLVYADFQRIEAQARSLLTSTLQFRADISPYQGEGNSFDELVRRFDERGWEGTGNFTGTLQTRLDQADRDLRQARDLYAFLTVYSGPSGFPNAADRPLLCPPTPEDPRVPAGRGIIDWCNFPARLRQSVRELATLHLIFGQQFTVDALDLYFGNEVVEGKDYVTQEVRKLEMAVAQFHQAEQALSEGLTRAVGNGCVVADFYDQGEWETLSRAVEGKERAWHAIAVRRSYLDDYDAAATLAAYQSAALDQYSGLIGAAGLIVQPQGPCTALGAQPPGEIVAKLVANLQDTLQSAQGWRAGRNLFGFDKRFTPARPYLTGADSTDRGLWNEAEAAAQQAKSWQNDAAAAQREFDENADQMRTALSNVQAQYDDRLLELTGCSRSSADSDEALFACIEQVVMQLSRCDVTATQAAFDQCISRVAQIPGAGARGLLRQSRITLRSARLRINAAQTAIRNLRRKIDIEKWRRATVRHRIYTAGQQEAAAQYALALIESIGVSSAKGSSQVSYSRNPRRKEMARLGRQGVIREAAKAIAIENAASQQTIRNLLLELGELDLGLQVAVQEHNAQAVQFETLAAEARDLAVEAQRARRYVAEGSFNNPGFRLVRDGARLRLARQLTYAAQVSYMAAKRAEYEYAVRLDGLACGAARFRMVDIYRARTADDILQFLTCLRALTDNLIVRDNEIQQEDFKLSVALHVLGLTDEYLGLTGNAARTERVRLFREWVAQNTIIITDTSTGQSKPALSFRFTTSLVDNGIFANVIQQGYDRFWLHQVAGIGSPKPSNTGFAINLITEAVAQTPAITPTQVVTVSQPMTQMQPVTAAVPLTLTAPQPITAPPGITTTPALTPVQAAVGNNLRYRRVVVTQAGLTHLRARNGCILEYRLLHPAALLGLAWPESQPAEAVSEIVKANVNDAGGERIGTFLARPVSASEWEVLIFAGAPEAGLDDMDLQRLQDIELIFSTTRAARTPGEPPVEECGE